MEFTGERVIPGQSDADLLNEHRARYLFAQRFSPGKTVLDAACGTGYGSALLAEGAWAVFGADISREAVEYAREHHRSPRVCFAQADCLALPFPDGRFELVVAFEIIEHLANPEAFLAELRRVLDPTGLLILSTPNRLYYTDDRGEINPFHVREFSYPEFEEILRPLFPHCAILYQNHLAGLLVSGPDARPDFASRDAVWIVEEKQASAEPAAEQRAAHFLIALGSARPLEPIEPFLYLPSTGNVLREREIHIHRLSAMLDKARADLEPLRQEVEERTRWAQELDRQLAEKDAYVVQLQKDYDGKIDWARRLDQELAAKGAALQALQEDYDRKIQWALSLEQDLRQARAALEQLRKEFEERTAWALKLDAELKERSEDLRLLYASGWYRLGKNLKLSPVPPSDPGGPGGRR